MIEIRERVREACQRPENVFGPAFFSEHLAVVAECCARLAPMLSADPEVVELAAWLHDLSAVLDPATLPTHPQASAALAARLLAERGFPAATAEAVSAAILPHSAPLAIGAASAEAVCLTNADAVARILRPAYWLYFAYTVRRLSFDDGRRWLHTLFQSQCAALIDPAREMVASRLDATLALLGD